MQFPFYKNNFLLTFDPLNYNTLIHIDFFESFMSNRKHIDFYCNLPMTIKENINTIYFESPVFNIIKKRSENYYKSFTDFSTHLLDTKLGIFYIEQKINEIPINKAKEIVQANKERNHELNIYIDEFIWDNYRDISSFIGEFKKQYDNNLNNIINNVKCKLDFKIYNRYKSYHFECANHISENYTLDEMIKNYHKNPELMTKAFLKKLDTNFDQVINILISKPENKTILCMVIDASDEDKITKIYNSISNDVKNNKETMFVLCNNVKLSLSKIQMLITMVIFTLTLLQKILLMSTYHVEITSNYS